jgi:hypothetical protein
LFFGDEKVCLIAFREEKRGYDFEILCVVFLSLGDREIDLTTFSSTDSRSITRFMSVVSNKKTTNTTSLEELVKQTKKS